MQGAFRVQKLPTDVPKKKSRSREGLVVVTLLSHFDKSRTRSLNLVLVSRGGLQDGSLVTDEGGLR